MPAELPDGLALVGVPERVDARDALCGAPSLAALAEGARVGTSSLRRAAELRALRPDLDVVALRGNVDTRLRKLADGACDAIVLALAGLVRLGRADAADCVLDELVPAAGQGTLAARGARGRRTHAGGGRGAGGSRTRPRASPPSARSCGRSARAATRRSGRTPSWRRTAR